MPAGANDALGVRVAMNERAIVDLDGQVREVRSTMMTQDDGRNIMTAVSALSSKLDQMRTTNWPLLIMLGGFALTFVSSIGILAYLPIREKQSDQGDRLTRMEQNYVPQSYHYRQWEIDRKAFEMLQADIKANQDRLVRREDYSQGVAYLQRQVDDLSKNVGSVVTTRDVLQDQSKKNDRLEMELRELRSMIHREGVSQRP